MKVTRLASAHETEQANLQKQSMMLREAERRASGNAYIGFLAISTFRFPALERSDDSSVMGSVNYSKFLPTHPQPPPLAFFLNLIV